MSGGHFNYKQYELGRIADEIEQLIRNNPEREYSYSKETIGQFMIAVALLRCAEIYTHRIDWLVSGDDGEDSFHRRLNSMLETTANEVDKLRTEILGLYTQQTESNISK